MSRGFFSQFRVLFVLAHVSGLPTVWSNCLAGWWLGGGGNFWKLPWLFFGMSVIYFGSSFLRAAFDGGLNRPRSLDHQMGSDVISFCMISGGTGLVIGGLCLFAAGLMAGVLGMILIACVVIYGVGHRVTTVSPWLLGVCRFFIYPIAAATGVFGMTGPSIWCGLAVGCYATGFGFLARRKVPREQISKWPIALLILPVPLGLLMNTGAYQQSAAIISMILLGWGAFCLRQVFQTGGEWNQTGPRLLAGFVLVDWLAIAPLSPREFDVMFASLFGLTLIVQRLAPVA